jgi:hypothetical protein
MNAKKYHIIVGLILILFGVVCTGFSVMQYMKPEHKVDKTKIMRDEANICKTKAITAGFNASFNGDILTVTSKRSNILDNPTSEVYKSSILISQCDKLEVKEFCLGQGCLPIYQKEFVLNFQLKSKMVDPVKSPPKTATPVAKQVKK